MTETGLNRYLCQSIEMKGAPISRFGLIALEAVEIYKKQTIKDPRKAWEEAAGWKDKGCPRGVFLTLCSEGLIKGIPRGNYGDRLGKNYEHTLQVMKRLDFQATDFKYKKTVWDKLDIPNKPSHNGHIDVIHALYEKDMLSK